VHFWGDGFMSTSYRKKTIVTYPLTLTGINVTLQLHRDRVIIHRKGGLCGLASATPADQEIYLRHVQYVELTTQMLTLTFRDRDLICILFAPQDEALAQQLTLALETALQLYRDIAVVSA
jgi:hypothetical protein